MGIALAPQLRARASHEARWTDLRPSTAPAHIAALLTRKGDQAQLENVLGSTVTVLRVSHAFALERIVETERVACVVTELHDVEGNHIEGTLRRIRERFPKLPIVVSLPLEPEAVREIVGVACLGSVRVAVRPHDNLPSAVLEAAKTAPDEPAAQAIRAILARHLTRTTLRVADAISHVPETAPTVAAVCGRANLPRRTINDRLRRAELPTLERLLGWSRVLHALWRIDGGHNKVDAVATQLGFNSGSALRHMVKRYTGLAPSQIHSVGGFAYALTLFENEFAARRGVDTDAASREELFPGTRRAPPSAVACVG